MAKKDIDTKQVTKAQKEEKKEQDKYRLNFSEEKKIELAERVCYLVEKDESDRDEFIKTRAKVRKMYEGIREPKSDPWKNCANVSTQVVNMVVELLHSRLYPSVWNDNLIYWKPMENNDIPNIENVAKFMQWVIKELNLGQVVDDYIHNLILDGTAVMKLRWVDDWKWVQRKIPIPESLTSRVKRVVMSFLGGKKEYKVPEQRYKVTYEYKKFENAKVEVLDLEDVGFPTYSVPTSDEEELEHIWHRSYLTLHDLKEMEAFGYISNVDKVSSHLDEILMKGTKKSDLEAEKTKITQNKYNNLNEIIEFYDKYDWNNDGIREDIILTVDRKSKTLLDARELMAYSRINERPFVVGQLIRRTNRMYGKSMGEVAMPLEEEINAIHNQRLDAGTMSIIPFGVYRAGSGFKPEDIEMEPGLWIPVDDINDAKWITVPNNVMVSFQEERMLMEMVEKVTSVGSYQSGQESDVNRSRSTARGTLAIIQQGEIRFSVLGKRCQYPLTRALGKLLRQYQDKLPPGIAERILGTDGEPVFPNGIAPEDLAGGYDAYMVLDSTGGSKQADNQMRASIYQNFVQNPFVMQNPAGFWQLSADTLKSTGMYNDPTLILGEQPQNPALHNNPQAENERMMQGEQVDVKDTDNVMEHIISHYSFRDTGEFSVMPPEYRINFDEHLKQTKEQLMQSFMNMQQQAQQQPEGVPPGGSPLQQPQGGPNANNQGIQQGAPLGAGPVGGVETPPVTPGAGVPGAGQEAA